MSEQGVWQGLPEAIQARIRDGSQVVDIAAGEVLFRAGDGCRGLPLVVTGTVRVQMTGASGHSIVLYRVEAGDVCTLSIGCLMTGAGYRAEAVTESPVTVQLLPVVLFEQLMAQSPEFRQVVMAAYGRRLDDLMLLVEEVAFRRMDERLAEWLAGHRPRGEIRITHQQLAVELGTAREVVSRLLKELEHQGQLQLGRGVIRFLGSSTSSA
ncbi:Crp/Fnr family transcriptional regulator [Marinobacter sp. CA1]|uniref:Crp/Fnr family transcriptional regulator n=1 Tax=Marinobacter sp. CA1 TaxID=2817656 RepID=UPI001D098F7B|nr:Crp/Fnr family transcriptional regulator [Marinobacter sp. CA1]UDL05121.1 Crp/Fnr family transcriptional regulator [Marinobacter sp. CA1]